jgi:hypothetical protein
MCADTLLLSAYTAQKSRLAQHRDPSKRGKTGNAALNATPKPASLRSICTVSTRPFAAALAPTQKLGPTPAIIHHIARICLDMAEETIDPFFVPISYSLEVDR